MNTTTVQIPLSVYRVLEDRDVWDYPEYRDLQVVVRGNRARITGDTATLSALGDYIDGLAGLVADRVVTGTGISARRWAEIAMRFPLVVTPTTETTNTECHSRPAIADVLVSTAVHVHDGSYGSACIRHTSVTPTPPTSIQTTRRTP